jgi:histidyl-tRNA synthetase
MLLPETAIETRRPVAVIPVNDSVEAQAFKLAFDLRNQGLYCEVAYSGNLSKRMKRAGNQKAWAAVVLGPDELVRGEVTVKLMDSGEQRVVKIDQLSSSLAGLAPA